MFERDDIIQHSYPKPIAFVYSKVIGSVDPTSRLDQSLRLFEVAMQYIVLTGIARIRGYDGDDREMLRDRLRALLRSPTPGTYVEAAQLLERVFTSIDDTLLGTPLDSKRTDLLQFAAMMKAIDPKYGGGKHRLLDVMSRITEIRNDDHHRFVTKQVYQQPDLLLNTIRELLLAIPRLRERVLVHARMVKERRGGVFDVKMVALMGDGGPKPLDDIRTLSQKLLQGSLYLFDPSEQTYTEVTPFFLAEGDDILCLAGFKGNEPQFLCPYTSITDTILADACRDLQECAPFLFGPDTASLDRLRDTVEGIAIDGVIDPKEMALLRRRVMDLGLATDGQSASEVAEQAIRQFGGEKFDAVESESAPPQAVRTSAPSRPAHTPGREPANAGLEPTPRTPTHVERPPDPGADLRAARSTPNAVSAPISLGGHRVPTTTPRSIPAGRGQGPFALPSRPRHRFVGRTDLLSSVRKQLMESERVALTGQPGVGKTSIALELAYDPEIAKRFQGNILWLELGPEPDCLGLLGDVGEMLHIPAEALADLQTTDARADAINAVIGSRPFLIVIDDAWTLDDALQMRLGSQRCAQLLTTRFLPVAHGFATVRPEKVSELDSADGMRLLQEFVPDVVRSEPDVALELVQLVGALPLALTLIGNHLRIKTAGRPRGVFKNEVRKLLQDSRERLALHQSDGGHSTEQSLDAIARVSVAALGESAARALSMLCVLPPKPSTFSETAAAAVSAEPIESVYELVDAGLVDFIEPDRLALNRILVDYVSTTCDASVLLEAKRRMSLHYFELLKNSAADVPTMELEHANILAALRQAPSLGIDDELLGAMVAFWASIERQGLHRLATDLLRDIRGATDRCTDRALVRDFLLCQAANAFALGSYPEAESALQDCLRLAEDSDNLILSRIHHRLGMVQINDFDSATEHFNEALTRGRNSGQPGQILDALGSLGMLQDLRGDYPKAEQLFRDAIAVARADREDTRYCDLLLHLGWAIAHTGRFSEARRTWQKALDLALRLGHRPHQAHALSAVGWVLDRQGQTDTAEQSLREGLGVARSCGHMHLVSTVLANHGALLIHRGELALARRALDEALDIVLRIGHEERRAVIVENLGLIDCRQGFLEDAERRFEEGLHLAGSRVKERIAALRTYLGEVMIQRGDVTRATELLASALSIAEELRNPERIAVAHRHTGRLHMSRDETDDAKRHFDTALEQATQLGYRWLIAALHLDMGTLLRPTNAVVARDHCTTAITIGTEIRSGDIVAQARYGLSHLEAKQGHPDAAIAMARECCQFFDAAATSEAATAREWLVSLEEIS